MLVLSREIGEAITVTNPDGVVLRFQIRSMRGQRISVGIEAPKPWKILRAELQEGTNETTMGNVDGGRTGDSSDSVLGGNRGCVTNAAAD